MKTPILLPEKADIKIEGDKITISFITKRESLPELPSYDEWYRNSDGLLVEKDGISFMYFGTLTRKELLRRYIEHLAGIVGTGNFSISYDHYDRQLKLSLRLSSRIDDSTLFSEEGAKRVIDHCPKELLELYGVK